MQGQSSPLQVKDPYTSFFLMHVGSSYKKHQSVQCTPLKNNQKLIGGSNKKNKQKASLSMSKAPVTKTDYKYVSYKKLAMILSSFQTFTS